MQVEQILEELQHLTPEELTRLKEGIRQREAEQQHEAQAWGAALESAAADFRGESTPEEMVLIFEAINQKSPPSSKGARV